MNNSVLTIALSDLALGFVPVVLVLLILYRWSLNSGRALYAFARMLVQLLLIGYVLSYIFAAEHPAWVLLVLTVMVVASSWIAMGCLEQDRWRHMGYATLAIAAAGSLSLWIVSQWVLGLDPWFSPQYLIPLAGMTYANAMNSVSLAAERFQAERERGEPLLQARHQAMQAAMLPVINSLFAVGLVSLPGMMTGQILSGVSPLIAARYQIVVMCMIFAASGLATAAYLQLVVRAQAQLAAMDSSVSDK